MAKNKYIDAETFQEFKVNQEKLIEILNHNMTNMAEQSKLTANSNIKLSNDVQWLKKIMGIQTTLIGGTFLALIGIVIEIIMGAI